MVSAESIYDRASVNQGLDNRPCQNLRTDRPHPPKKRFRDNAPALILIRELILIQPYYDDLPDLPELTDRSLRRHRLRPPNCTTSFTTALATNGPSWFFVEGAHSRVIARSHPASIERQNSDRSELGPNPAISAWATPQANTTQHSPHAFFPFLLASNFLSFNRSLKSFRLFFSSVTASNIA